MAAQVGYIQKSLGSEMPTGFLPITKKLPTCSTEIDVYQYPIIHELEFETGLELERYPKAGEANPTVNLIVDIETGEVEQVPTNSGPDTHIVRPIWRDNSEELTFRRLNRKQDHLELLSYTLESKEVRTLFTEREDATSICMIIFISLTMGSIFFGLPNKPDITSYTYTILMAAWFVN